MSQTTIDIDRHNLSRREALGAIAAIGVGSAAVGAGTFAAFTDTENSTDNSLTTGVLDLSTGGTHSLSFTPSDIAPGDSGYSKVSLKNSGNVSGTLEVNISSISTSEGTTPESESTGDSLDKALELKLFLEPSGGSGQFTDGTDQGLLTDGTVTQDATNFSYSDADAYPIGTTSSSAWSLGTLDTTHDFVVRWKLPSDGGDADINAVMDDTITIDLKFTLTQK